MEKLSKRNREFIELFLSLDDMQYISLSKRAVKILYNYYLKAANEINSLENQLDFIGYQNKYIDKLEKRINKAIKWINENKYYFPSPNELINILQGDNK